MGLAGNGRRACSATTTPRRSPPRHAGAVHIVTMPYFCLRRRMPCTMVAVRIAPVAPADAQRDRAASGLTTDGSVQILITASDCAAKASLSSIQSSWSWSARLASALSGIAAIGPMPITPAHAGHAEADEARERVRP